jgi:phosphatidylglycerophosphate synthase
MKKYLADALSLLRACAIAPIAVYAWMGNWHVAFLIFVAAWLTDLVDGILARRYGTLLSAEFDIDGKADAILGFGSTAIVLIYAWSHYNTVVAVALSILYALTVVFGLWMVTIMNKPLTPARRWVTASNMIFFHSVVQIGATLVWFDYMASGKDAALRLIGGLAIIAGFNFRKITLWWSGRLRPETTKI